MARLLYGGSGADVVFQDTNADNIPEISTSTVFSVWTTRTGSTQVTDLQNLSGQAISTVSPDADGRIMFFGPDGTTSALWLRNDAFTSKPRWRIDPGDLADRASVTDHGLLGGLNPDDDHPQYFNTTRGDARYVRIANERNLLDELDDVAITAPADGQFLVRSGGQFANQEVQPEDVGAAPSDYSTLVGFVPVILLNAGDPVPGGTPAPALLVYQSGSGVAWGFGADLGGQGAVTNTATLTVTQTVPVGTLVVIGMGADAAGSVQATWAVSDSKGNSWSQATSQIQSNTQQSAQWRSRITTQLVNGDTITVSTTEARQHIAFKAATVTGAANPALDKTTTNGISTSQPTSFSVGPTANTVQADEIAFGVFSWTGGIAGDVFTATGGGTRVGSVQPSSAGASHRSVALVYQVMTAIGGATLSGSLGATGSSWSANAATYKKA